MQRIVIYQRKNRLFAWPSSKTVQGLWINSGPAISLAADEKPENIGVVVDAALDQSESGVAHPTAWVGGIEPLLSEAGVKTYKTFVNGTLSVSVEREGQSISFVPTANLGHQQGFAPIADKKVTLGQPTTEEIGRQLLIALGDAR